jgi:hypothetical protein
VKEPAPFRAKRFRLIDRQVCSVNSDLAYFVFIAVKSVFPANLEKNVLRVVPVLRGKEAAWKRHDLPSEASGNGYDNEVGRSHASPLWTNSATEMTAKIPSFFVLIAVAKTFIYRRNVFIALRKKQEPFDDFY